MSSWREPTEAGASTANIGTLTCNATRAARLAYLPVLCQPPTPCGERTWDRRTNTERVGPHTRRRAGPGAATTRDVLDVLVVPDDD
jgi:hypothetical protein